jgi:DNA transposition AAA+ family ATPase
MTPTNNYTAAERRQQLAANATDRTACIAEINDYMARAGLHRDDFARRINYSPSTMRMFLADNYHVISGNAEHIMREARAYIASHPVAPQTSIHGELFETANVRMLRDTFESLLPRPRAFMVYAPPGSQKTFVLEHLVCELNAREIARGADGARAIYVYCRQGIKPQSLMKRIAQACGSSTSGDIDRILSNLRHDHAGRRVILNLDEAQHLSLECFEVIRELLDRLGFSLLIAGSHDLFLMFERGSARMEQWNSRIVRKVRLPGCGLEEARGIVEREVGAILDARNLGAKRERVIASLISGATVTDAYTAVKPGEKKAQYINIRTLCNALDDVKMGVAKAQPSPVPAVQIN